MCDCSNHPCKVCGKMLPLHLADFDTAQNEVECFCGKHIPKDRTDVKVWQLLNEDRRDYKTTKMAIKALTDNARRNWDGNAPNADCEEIQTSESN